MQAAAPARLIEGGLPTEGTLAHIVVSKYADHLPLYRQSQIYARGGVDLDRSTPATWCGKVGFHLARSSTGCWSTSKDRPNSSCPLGRLLRNRLPGNR
jgi:transposase